MTRRASEPRPGQSILARDQMKQRCFLPKQRDTMLQTLRYALRIKSEEDLPKVFRLPVAVALKPGSQDELTARFNVPENKTDPRRMAFESAMTLYCRSSQYGHALLTCDQLFSIDMEPDGPPASEDRARGRALLGLPARREPHGVPDKTGKAGNSAPAKTDRTGSGDDHPGPRPAAQAKPGTAPAKKQQPRLTPTQLRTFYPEQRREQLRRFCEALAVTEEDLPAFLAEPVAVPLKIGTSKDLSQRYGVRRNRKTPERRSLDTALRGYCGSFQYQHAILSCDTRFSIDMDPAEPITDDARQHAIDRLRERARRRKARREQPTCDDSGT